MRLVAGPDVLDIDLASGAAVTFGRGADADIRVGADDPAVSRIAGRVAATGGLWVVENLGSRSFSLVEPGAEIELVPPTRQGRHDAPVLYPDVWIRLPGSEVDHAVVLDAPDDERPPAQVLDADLQTAGATIAERPVTLTDNQLRSVVAVYESYLRLPPLYERSPAGYDSAARRLRVKEGKVRADLRKVREKVERATGQEIRGRRRNDVLIEWLMARGLVRREHLSILDDV